MSQIIEKTVKRHFVNGKGYSSKFAACMALAKAELKDQACKWVYAKMEEELGGPAYSHSKEFESFVHRFYLERFPLYPSRDACPHVSQLSDLCRLCQCIDHTGSPRKDWCNKKRWEWIRARARVILAEENILPLALDWLKSRNYRVIETAPGRYDILMSLQVYKGHTTRNTIIEVAYECGFDEERKFSKNGKLITETQT